MSYKSKRLRKPVHNKKKKKKKLVSAPKAKRNNTDMSAFKDFVMDKPRIMSEIHSRIDRAIRIFESYDRIQLLGGIGLKLIDNLPTIDKVLDAQMYGNGKLNLDDKAEVVMEYAMNFGTAMASKSTEAPTKETLDELYQTLSDISQLYNVYDMPVTETDYDAWLTWMVHMDHIFVRGEGYASIVETVFDELFIPHDDFFKNRYGFGFATLKTFCTEIERFILSKIGNMGGSYLAGQRWKEDSEKQYGTGDDAIERMLQDKPENGVMGSMPDRSPDLFAAGPQHLLVYQPDDFGNSDKIFWVVPQTDEQRALYEKLSWNLGDNAAFLAEGDYKGNVMSGMELYKKPLVKIEEKYFCFTPMIPHRNMIAIAESLIKEDGKYYEKHYRSNTEPQSRDQYMEHRVAELFKRLMPKAKIHPSVSYKTDDGEKMVKTELDVLCLSEKATYLIEIKGHELSNADKVKIKGFKDKFSDSVGYGCYQACRAENHILNEDATFHKKQENIVVDKNLPVFKIVVTLQHFSSVIGHFEYLVKCGLMEPDYWNVWAVSLYDLIVVFDQIDKEESLMEYLVAHSNIQKAKIEFQDELDVIANYLSGRINEILKARPSMIIGGSEDFDAKYENRLPLITNTLE